jgi:hypothetical protein
MIEEEEELRLVHKAVETEMREMEAGKIKTHSFEEIKEFHAIYRFNEQSE